MIPDRTQLADSKAYQVAVDELAPAEWAALLGDFEDASVYQTVTYGAVRWGASNVSHITIQSRGSVMAAAQVRIVRLGRLPGGLAHVRWGPLIQRKGAAVNEDVMHGIAGALHDEYVVRRRLHLQVYPNVFVGSPVGEMFDDAFRRLFVRRRGTPTQRTFLLRLNKSLEEIRKELDQKWRNQLNRAEKINLAVRVGESVGEFQVFSKLYSEMHQRKGFQTSVNVEEFEKICDALPNSSRLRIFLCYAGDAAVAGIVCSAMGNTGIYLLGATSSAAMQTKGAYLLQWAAIQWLKTAGFRYYDLGGIDPLRNPGVYHFKKGIAGEDVTRLDPYNASVFPLSALYHRIASYRR